MQLKVHAAKWWEKEEDSKTRCLLCPRRCLIPDGGAGVCAVRLNRGGELVSQAYGYPVALQIDPIEKKPLRHFLPRTGTFSIGTLGCNLKCHKKEFYLPVVTMQTAALTLVTEGKRMGC